MDRFSKWAIAGSLAWLAVAVGLILGTHGGSQLSARGIETPEEPVTSSWSVMPVAGTHSELTVQEFKRC